MFGGKGYFLPFFKDIEELYTHMLRISDTLKSSSFFILDENFLLNKKNAMELLSFMEKDQKAWSLYVFSSANALKQYSIDELIRLGITWIWMGVEGEQSDYDKLNNVNTKEMVNSFQKNGIVVLGSSIICLDFHTQIFTGKSVLIINTLFLLTKINGLFVLSCEIFMKMDLVFYAR